MYRLLGAACLVLSGGGCATVPVPVAPPFQQQVERHVAAIQARDLSEIERTVTSEDDLLLILPSGRMTQTRADYLSFHRSLFSNTQWAMTFEPLHFQAFDDYGHALYRVTFDSDGAGPEAASPAYLALGFRLERGEWRLVHDQNTSIKP